MEAFSEFFLPFVLNTGHLRIHYANTHLAEIHLKCSMEYIQSFRLTTGVRSHLHRFLSIN